MTASIAVAALIVGQTLQKRRAAREDAGPPRVLVSAFENRTGDPSRDSIGRMAAERISEGLTKAGIVEVIPAVVALGMAEGGEATAGRAESNLADQARRARADFTISGAYQLRADSLAFHAEICDFRKGKAVCILQTAAAAEGDPAPALDQLRSRVMGGVAISVEPPVHGYDKTRPPAYEAYRAYMDAMLAFSSSEETEMIAHCERAVAIDSTFLAPHFALSYWWAPARAESLMRRLDRQRESLCPVERVWIDYRLAALRGDNMDAMWALRKLREMDPDNAGLLMEGAIVASRVNRPREAIRLFSEWDPARMPGGPSLFAQRFRLSELSELHHRIGEDGRALELARSAIEIFPEDLDSRTDELAALASLGRTEEVRAASENWFTMWSQGWARPGRLSWGLEELKRHGYRDEALRLAERAVRWCEARVSEGEPHRYALAVGLYQAERWDEAAALYGELAREYPDRIELQWPLGTLAARRGDRDEALQVLERIMEMNDPYLYGADEYACARIAAQLGDLDRAVSFLSDAMSHGYGLTAQAHHAIDLEPLWDYPPFQEFMRPKG